MATVVYKPGPVNQVSDQQGRLHRAFETVRLCLKPIDEFLRMLGSIFTASPGSGGSGSGTAAGLATRVYLEWCANGPYRVDTTVDGAAVLPTDAKITKVYLWRGTHGTAGSTILDVNVIHSGSTAPTTLYTTQANRPTITYNAATNVIACPLPDVLSLIAGDAVTVDTDQKESGLPLDWRLRIEAA